MPNMPGKNTVRAKKPNLPKSVGKEVNKKSTKKVVQQDAGFNLVTQVN